MSRLVEHRLGYRHLGGRIEDLGPMVVRERVLDFIDENPSGVQQKPMAAALGITQATVSRHLKALVRKGYVRREFTEYNEPVVYFPKNPREERQ